MTATNHGLFGAVIAISLQKYPAAAIAISPFSHILLDIIPHYGGLVGDALKTRSFFLYLLTDATLAVITTLAVAWAWQDIALLVVVCAFLSAAPDLMWAYYQYDGVKYINKHFLPKFHDKIQWAEHLSGPFIYTDLVFFLIFFPALIYAGTM